MEGPIQTNDEHSRGEGMPELNATMTGTSEHGILGAPSVGVLTEHDLPGLRSWSGRDIEPEDVKEVIGLLDKVGVPACVVDVYALRYYGAGRISNVSEVHTPRLSLARSHPKSKKTKLLNYIKEWNICVPDKDFDTATDLFQNDVRFALAKPVSTLDYSLLHTRPTFRMTGVGFYFIIVPTSDCFIEPSPDNCELSSKGISYPKMHHFARSLLVLQNDRCNLNDFIDGMDLDKEWAEVNVDYEELQYQGLEFTRKFNAELEKEGLGKLKLDVDYRNLWNLSVDEKVKRIEPMKQGRYKTRWRRIKNDTDPRQRDRPI